MKPDPEVTDSGSSSEWVFRDLDDDFEMTSVTYDCRVCSSKPSIAGERAAPAVEAGEMLIDLGSPLGVTHEAKDVETARSAKLPKKR